MQYIVNILILDLSARFQFWRRYIDEIVLVAKLNDLEVILILDISVCIHVTFIIQHENNGYLPFF